MKQAKFKGIQAHDPESAIQIIGEEGVNLVLQDMNFSRSTTGEEGMLLLSQILSVKPQLPVILMTAWGSISSAVQGMRLGASDFISKPCNNQHLLPTIATAIGLASPDGSSNLSRRQLDDQYNFVNIVGESPALIQTLATLARVSKTDASILLWGESGTGKEVLADAIHHNSPRRQNALVKVNLGGITPSLFESEMFGHVKGAFTDAKQDRQGRFLAADGGTLFLDEIGELDKSSQVKLLRVLQDQNFQMVGSSKNTSVNVRIISATNRNLEDMVKDLTFREDLFYRINLIALNVPPLRDRISDIPLLAMHHLKKVSKLYGIPPAVLSPQALNWLQNQTWPGNIRQLFQTIERVLLMSGKRELDYMDFEPDNALPTDNTTPNLGSAVLTLEETEKIMIERALSAHQGNISKMADALGLSRAALYRRLEKHGLHS